MKQTSSRFHHSSHNHGLFLPFPHHRGLCRHLCCRSKQSCATRSVMLHVFCSITRLILLFADFVASPAAPCEGYEVVSTSTDPLTGITTEVGNCAVEAAPIEARGVSPAVDTSHLLKRECGGWDYVRPFHQIQNVLLTHCPTSASNTMRAVRPSTALTNLVVLILHLTR